ncbi:NAD(P)-binding domain-containing protein [Fibrella aquatilis]|uniref:NAD(P)H-binding protein n=1 Tax=Fibrella aquatilis TaxID=2817059 RepID=A0A939K2A7_9BACT|nr:NAD(P)-binding domain-containing protein [Fibrella aquatilis]MBO0934358.1 NAD(P)H-binding protein [Fibrella aquatilis]
MSQPTISIIGLGWLGMPLAEALLTAGHRVLGSTTTPDKVALLRLKGIDAQQLSLNPQPVGELAPLLAADVLVVNVPPKAGQQGDAFHPEQMRLLAQAVAQSRVGHVIYVSSTSVYPELNREMVEADVVTPEQSAASRLVEAEQHWLALSGQKQITILRCGGLMGDTRIPGKYVAGRVVDSGAVLVNYIHQTDAVGLLLAIIRQNIVGTFNAVAPQHPTREAIYRKSCADFGYALPTFVTPTQPVSFKQINGDKLTAATQYQFIYPDPLLFSYQ